MKYKRVLFLIFIEILFLLGACSKKEELEQVKDVTPTIQETMNTSDLVEDVINTPIPTVTPTTVPTLTPTMALTATPTTVPTITPIIDITKEDININDFFVDSVFAGDSVMSHFYWMAVHSNKIFDGSTFLVKISYALREALKTDSDFHPMYQGKQIPIWESMKLMPSKPKRVFLFFGLNDIGITGVDGFLENYKKMVAHLQETVPDIKIYILSVTPMRADCEKEILNNVNITKANEALKEYCLNNNIGYIDVATMLLDEDGALDVKYSDGTNVHLTKDAYALWREVLVEYGTEVLLSEQKETQ